MNGRTHEMVAAASAVLIMHEADTRAMAVGCLVAITAGTLPDIDLVDNRKGKGPKMLIEVIKQSMVIIGMAAYYGSGIDRIAIWTALCILMVLQPHRGLSHSIAGMAVMGAVFSWITSRQFAGWFAVGYGSHVLLDLLNTKDVSLLYPYGTCLGLVKSGGLADDIIGALAAGLFIISVVLRFAGIDLVQEVVRMAYGG